MMLTSFKTAIALGLAAATLATPNVASAAPLGTWYGTYVWEESLGRIGGSTPAEGAAAFVTRTLSLGPSAGDTGCTVNAEGYQTYEQMKCTATPEGESVIIKFYKFGANAPGRYRVGAPLFTMTRTGSGLMTRLQGMRPSSDASPSSGMLFRRAG
jgi:hypothetical protein